MPLFCRKVYLWKVFQKPFLWLSLLPYKQLRSRVYSFPQALQYPHVPLYRQSDLSPQPFNVLGSCLCITSYGYNRCLGILPFYLSDKLSALFISEICYGTCIYYIDVRCVVYAYNFITFSAKSSAIASLSY